MNLGGLKEGEKTLNPLWMSKIVMRKNARKNKELKKDENFALENTESYDSQQIIEIQKGEGDEEEEKQQGGGIGTG